MVANHALVPYECGDESGCASCGSGRICADHACADVKVTAPSNGTVGQTVAMQIIVGSAPCSSCELKITLPDGTTMTANTDANGDFSLLLAKAGDYTISVMKNGQPVKTITISAPLAQPTTKPSTQPASSKPDLLIPGIIGLVLVVLVVLGVVLLLKKKPPEGGESGKYQGRKK
jgi:hypothetical protein